MEQKCLQLAALAVSSYAGTDGVGGRGPRPWGETSWGRGGQNLPECTLFSLGSSFSALTAFWR